MTSFMTSRPRSGNLKRAIVAGLAIVAVLMGKTILSASQRASKPWPQCTKLRPVQTSVKQFTKKISKLIFCWKSSNGNSMHWHFFVLLSWLAVHSTVSRLVAFYYIYVFSLQQQLWRKSNENQADDKIKVMQTHEKDSGYAWIVVLSSFLCHTIQYGLTWTVGVFYVIFLEE